MMVVIFVLLCILGVQVNGEIEPVVMTRYGSVRGTIMNSRRGRSFSAFRGIPYARPPVGEFRFKPPQELSPWRGVYNATRNANICVQQNYLFSQYPNIEGSEDCLYLNVYTPMLASSLKKTFYEDLLPVMVFIHYGGFFAGSSSSDLLGPEFLMDKDVLLVTFNYRLGVFGFFSTYDDVAPGNWALKDQVAVLQWVRRNIARFGGDPERVTIFGQSAGAASVHHHILSPQSKGLFQAAITQSGSALALWAKPQRELALIVAKAQAEIVGCNSNVTTMRMVNCLRRVPAYRLAESIDYFRFMRSEPLTVYGPTIEIETENNTEPFITKDPLEIIENEEFSNVPWIVGVTSDEGILRAAPFTRQTDLLEIINSNFDENLVEMLQLQMSVEIEEVLPTWSKIKEFYFLNESTIDVNNPRSIQGLINVYSDRAFTFSSYQMSLFHKHKGHENVWFYYFDYRGNQSYGELFAATDNQVNFEWGVSHCDDLLYLFKAPKLFPNITLTSSDLELSYFMVTLFTNFATHLDPTPPSIFEEAHRWVSLPNTQDKEVMENSDLYYQHIAGKYGDGFTIRVANEYLPDRMSFWIDLPLRENIGNLVS